MNDIGRQYVTLKDQTILTRDESSLSEEERKLRKELEAFEQHYFECSQCRRKVRMDQEIRSAFIKLDESEWISRAAKSARTRQWLALAASLLLVSTISLSVWVGVLKSKPGDTGGPHQPEALSQVYMLQRSARTDMPRIPGNAQSFLLLLDLPLRVTEAQRCELEIIDAGGKVRWKDKDARLSPSGRFIVHIQKGFLDPGDYRIESRILNRKTKEQEAKDTYYFSIESSAG
ncbi:hypothetical protein ACFLU6_07355 [Acidobacteriota bacterium]